MDKGSNHLNRGLKNRHVQLISIGGAIGTGLFLGSGRAIQLAGPSILLTYIITGIFCFLIMRALGELLLSNLNHESFVDFVEDYLGKKAAFITGWTYWFCWIALAMSDLTGVGTYFHGFAPNTPMWIPEVLTLLILLLINLTTVSKFGELEFWFAMIKVVAIIGIILIGIYEIIANLGAPHTTVSVANLVNDGGFFPHGIKGFLLSFQLVVFAFVGIEVVGVIAGETKDPERVIPHAINNIPIRIILFYVLSIFVALVLAPWSHYHAGESPFIHLFTEIGITFGQVILNVVVISAAASGCNSCLYSTGRMLHSLAEEGNGIKKFGELSKRAVPRNAIIFSSVIVLVAVLLNKFFPSSAFEMVSSISTICFVVVWAIIVFTHIKMMQAGVRSTFKLPFAPYSNWLILIFLVIVGVIMLFAPATRVAMFFTPVWFIILLTFYYFKFEHKKPEKY
ncbi:MAG: amino acid permease [Lactobacillales bacterium]|jgi:D-serine/D-alanine/glycine transporter|nr:amino acid permease [Lactobacillales bacterium]